MPPVATAVTRPGTASPAATSSSLGLALGELRAPDVEALLRNRSLRLAIRDQQQPNLGTWPGVSPTR
jgi:hypothetical protein